MRNLVRYISAVLASALRNLDSSQYYDFKSALKCVRALVDFSLMVQYHSHTPDTLAYMERYLQTFNQTKDIFLKFSTAKSTCAEANRQDSDLRELMANQRAKQFRHNTVAERRWQMDQERLDWSNRQAYLIRRENHFNFIRMHYLSHFASNIPCFGSISMYSTEIGELGYTDSIKDPYQRSIKNDTARQILSQYGNQHALGMRLQTMEALSKTEGVIV